MVVLLLLLVVVLLLGVGFGYLKLGTLECQVRCRTAGGELEVSCSPQRRAALYIHRGLIEVQSVGLRLMPRGWTGHMLSDLTYYAVLYVREVG